MNTQMQSTENSQHLIKSNVSRYISKRGKGRGTNTQHSVLYLQKIKRRWYHNQEN
jgi:hypothetical protein